MFATSLGRFRIIGLSEGISYLLLLLIAMPLKYLLDLPMAVTIVGMIHGLLFILYILALIHVSMDLKWPFQRIAIAVVAAIIPIGSFILDARLKKEQVSTSQITS